MDAPSPASRNAGPAGCIAAIAIGVLVVAAQSATFSLLTGRPLNLADEWHVLLVDVLIVAAPFGLLALVGVRNRLPWLVGLALTLGFWSYVVYQGVSYQWHRDGSGANIGLGLIMIFIAPPFIAAASFGVHAWQRRRRPPRT